MKSEMISFILLFIIARLVSASKECSLEVQISLSNVRCHDLFKFFRGNNIIVQADLTKIETLYDSNRAVVDQKITLFKIRSAYIKVVKKSTCFDYFNVSYKDNFKKHQSFQEYSQEPVFFHKNIYSQSFKIEKVYYHFLNGSYKDTDNVRTLWKKEFSCVRPLPIYNSMFLTHKTKFKLNNLRGANKMQNSLQIQFTSSIIEDVVDHYERNKENLYINRRASEVKPINFINENFSQANMGFKSLNVENSMDSDIYNKKLDVKIGVSNLDPVINDVNDIEALNYDKKDNLYAQSMFQMSDPFVKEFDLISDALCDRLHQFERKQILF